MRAGELGEDRQICMERRSTLDAVRVHAESAALGLSRRCPPEPLAPGHLPSGAQYHLPFAKPPKATRPTSAMMSPTQKLHTIIRTMPTMTRMPPRPIPPVLPPVRSAIGLPPRRLRPAPRLVARRV